MNQFLTMNFGLIPIPPVPDGFVYYFNCEPTREEEIVCRWCNRPHTKKGNFCTPECRTEYKKQYIRAYAKSGKMKPRKKHQKVCEYCGTHFETEKKISMCCSPRCGILLYNAKKKAH